MRSKATLLCTGLAALMYGGASHSAPPDHSQANLASDSRVQIGLKISPVPLDLRGKNVARVGLGSYLVNAVGGCNDCHTNPSYLPGGDPHMGETAIINAEQYLAGGTAFGPFISANITPDENGLPAGLTFEEFEHVMRTGEDPDEPGRLLQVMPWPVFSHMTDRDLRAIYDFLSAIPSRPDNTNPSD